MRLPSSFAIDLLNSKLRRVLAKESDKWKADGPWRWPSVCYTLEHKLAFLEREHYLTGHYSLKGIFHDWEKPFLYLSPWIASDGKVQEIHRRISPHHAETVKTVTVDHLIEMYIDWDCASITKPDKPLNSFETLVHFYPKYMREMLPVCLAMNIECVKNEIYIHPWHDLAKNLSYNKEVYSMFLSVLSEIVARLPHDNLAFEIYRETKTKDVKQMLGCPAQIFMLVLDKQRRSLNCRLKSWITIDSILSNLLSEMRKFDCFHQSAQATVAHDYKKINPNRFCRSKS